MRFRGIVISPSLIIGVSLGIFAGIFISQELIERPIISGDYSEISYKSCVYKLCKQSPEQKIDFLDKSVNADIDNQNFLLDVWQTNQVYMSKDETYLLLMSDTGKPGSEPEYYYHACN